MKEEIVKTSTLTYVGWVGCEVMIVTSAILMLIGNWYYAIIALTSAIPFLIIGGVFMIRDQMKHYKQ